MIRYFFNICLLLCLLPGFGSAQETDADYKVQGEYSGTLTADGQEIKFGLQVIALGEGKFTGVGYMGGLPGDGWDGSENERVEASIKDGTLTFTGAHGTAKVKDGIASVSGTDVGEMGTISRLVRESKTLGKKPTEGATVLFDGSSVDSWELKGKPGKMTSDGLLKQGTASKKLFQDHRIHIEFLLPYMPKARSQQRGNSGIYVQGRYEVQMLDSFGLTGEHNECGGIYEIQKPALNMCYPPMQWQTYDIEFHAAKYDGDKKIKNARINVEHNGVQIHDAVELPKKTRAAPNNEGPDGGFIYLQNHGNQIRYRNIWVEEIVAETESAEAAVESVQTRQSAQITDDLKMEYWEYLPEGYEAQDKWPLMLFLHGAGERGDNLDKVKVHGPPKLVEAGKQFPFIVISPQCKKESSWDAEELTILLDQVEKKYKVDASRIYLTGLSMGGYGSWALGAHSPERFAAIVPICGGGDVATVPEKIGDKVPIWVFHGGKDGSVPISESEELVEAFKKIGVECRFTVYPEAGHDSWIEAYANPKLYEWFLSHARK